MDLSKYAALFLAESREHLAGCNQSLLEWERDLAATEPVGNLFRAIHTIKGMAATMGHDTVASLAHRTESLLDAVRGGRVAPTPEVVQLLFSAVDGLTTAVGRVGRGEAEDESEHAALLTELDAAAGAASGTDAAEDQAGQAEVTPLKSRLVEVMIRPMAPLRGGRALLALRRAEALGRVQDVRPGAHMFERDDFDGRFTFRLTGDLDDGMVEAAIRAAGDVEQVLVGDAVQGGAVAARRQIRVDLGRLDALMKHVGELVVARNRLADIAGRSGEEALGETSERIARLVSALQAEVLAARMSPVAEVFDRFPRVARDLARELGKQVRIDAEGGSIELDRAVLDEIGEPLLHLIRNALDHGIESPADRIAAGKPAEGRLQLSATRERNTVAIRVNDDGRGIDRAAILARGRRDGSIGPDVTVLSDDLLLRILARAGFSTATRVSGVSGRGVGIDIAVTRARALGGTLSVTSEQGKGTTWTLRVPLTLAIVRALLAGVGDERYAVPIAFVAETVEFDARQVSAVRDREAMVVREQAIPTVHLRREVGIEGKAPARRPGIILEVGERRAALVVDRLLGQQDIVVEPFEAPDGLPPFLGGATILADGAPALILDAAALV
ncbi:MAG TPA: chemotaxis protein CheA [Gemmatimonadales bacterium]|nr:chemotaxis protein CheA [Gemmatimonadales bacterium]